MSELQTHAAEIAKQFSDHIDVSTDEIEQKLEQLVTEYKVPVDEAKRSVTNSYLDEADLDRDELGRGGAESVLVGEIDQDEQWVDVTVTVVDLWEPRSESVSQIGLVGDESGSIKFVAFETSELPELEEGTSYSLENVVTDEYQGDYSIKLNRTTTITELDEDVEVDHEELDRSDSESVLVGEIDQDEQWVDITVRLVDLWEPRSESVSQIGLVGDESGRIKFVAFETSELPELEEGASYSLENVVTDEYQGDYSIKLNRTTTITKLDEKVEVGDNSTTVEGALVDVQSGSGLIKRCPEEGCTRVLQNGRCSEHGEVEGEFDLRIKAVIDDGHEVHDVIFNRESTKALTGIELEEAKQQAMDALDTTVVADGIREDIVGRYFRVTGPTLGRYVLANEFEQLGGPTDTDATLTKVRSLQ